MTLAGGNPHAGPPLDGLNIWPVISTGAESPHRELLHNFDTSLKPVAGFRGALRRGDLKLIVRVRRNVVIRREWQLPATILCGQVNNSSLYNISAGKRVLLQLPNLERQPGGGCRAQRLLRRHGSYKIACEQR